ETGDDHGHRQENEAHRGGEAQRLMLAIGIAAGPEVLLVDEPTAQLDQTTAAAVNETIARMAEEGVIVVVATHDERTRRACSAELRLADHEARPDDRAGAA
ncbi:MAG: ABC transporter ATP-binding protein, partial [Pseudoclavibacter sp.]|nr:ABC transporter ATP-binding protein [Pseudoclavibacter sp.]